MLTSVLITILSVGTIVGFIAGLSHALPGIAANHYIQYGMFRSAALELQPQINRWMLILLATCTMASVLLVACKLAWKFCLSTAIKTNATNHYKIKIICISIVCILFFCYAGWAINHYWIPYEKFHPISLLADVAILVFSILFVWFFWKILKKVQWKKRFNNLCEKRYLPAVAISLVVLLLLLNISVFIYTKIHSARGPNLVFIMVDALRQDHLGCYGYHRDTSPGIDEIARQGVIFNHAYSSSPWTKPSVASLFRA